MEEALCEVLKLEGKYRKIIADTMIYDGKNYECLEATHKLQALLELEDILMNKIEIK